MGSTLSRSALSCSGVGTFKAVGNMEVVVSASSANVLRRCVRAWRSKGSEVWNGVEVTQQERSELIRAVQQVPLSHRILPG